MATKLDQALLTDGATVVRNLFDDDKIAKLLELYDYCFEHPSPIALSQIRGEDRSYSDMLNSDPRVRELTEEALEGLPIGEMLSEVWGSEHVWYLTEEIFLKESKTNKNRGGFHQDSSFAPWEGEHWANFWISFDPVPEENGLEILKGTHLGPQYEVGEIVLYFKLMSEGQVWLLWCQSIRLVRLAPGLLAGPWGGLRFVPSHGR